MRGHGDPSFGNGRPTLGRTVLIWKTALNLPEESQMHSRAVGKMYAYRADSSGYVTIEPERLGPQTGSSGNRQSPDNGARVGAWRRPDRAAVYLDNPAGDRHRETCPAAPAIECGPMREETIPFEDSAGAKRDDSPWTSVLVADESVALEGFRSVFAGGRGH